MMDRTITVTGTGSAAAQPDWVNIGIQLVSRSTDYGSVLDDAAHRAEKLLVALKPLGFRKEDLRSRSFRVDTEYENIPDGRGGSTRRFCGYRIDHDLDIDFQFTMRNLSSVLASLTGSGAQPEFDINFSVHDEKALRRKALSEATSAALRAAKDLADGCRVALGAVQHIEYGTPCFGRSVSPTDYGAQASAAVLADLSRSIPMQPEDVSITDTVTVTWEVR